MVKLSSKRIGELVLSAIKQMTKNTGWTTRTISKFVKQEYRIKDPKISRKVSRALKRGVKLGVLQTERGRYRLNHNMSSLVRSTAIQRVQFLNLTRRRRSPCSSRGS